MAGASSRCIGRELVFPQFTGLLVTASEIAEGYCEPTPEMLETAVAENLQPGGNSAYNDLLQWRSKLRDLRLLDRTIANQNQTMLGADPVRDNYLYQIWIFYELGDFLIRTRGHDEVIWDHTAQKLMFTWGEGDSQRRYQLQHDQNVKHGWQNTPGLRPDFYIAPADPLILKEDGVVIWQEPGFILDAKYYRPTEASKTPSGPLKRMIADLTLAGIQYGALLFAFHGEELVASTAEAYESVPANSTATAHPRNRVITPPLIPDNAIINQRATPDTQIYVHAIPPTTSDEKNDLQWQHLLDMTHRRIGKPVEVRCHGVFVDTLTATAHGTLWSATALTSRNQQEIQSDDLVICPKPHIGAWRIDLVSASADCCKNGVVCHIKHLLPNAQPPRRLKHLDDVIEAIRDGTTHLEGEERVQVATHQVKVVVERFADLLNPDLASYEEKVRHDLDLTMTEQVSLISGEQWRTLALARFLWEQIDRIKAENYAGPVLLYTGVLEEVIVASLGNVLPPLKDYHGKKLKLTLGTFGYYHHNKKDVNYPIVYQYIVKAGHWDSSTIAYPFEKWLESMETIAKIRNEAGHRAKTNKSQFTLFYRHYCGSIGSGYGALNGLYLSWH